MIEKRVVAVIVEGQSDENAIGGILKEYFASKEVQFAVVHGERRDPVRWRCRA